MSKSRKNPARDKKLQDFKKLKKTQNQIKTKINQIMEERTQPNSFGLPEVRQFPVWAANEQIILSGQEWQTIYNFIESASTAFMAANAAMSRNIVSGVVRLKFEKLNKELGVYEPMTQEEEAPYQKEVSAAIENAVKQQAIVEKQQASQQETLEYPSQEGLPRIDSIVDQNGNELKSGDDPKSNLIVV